jgi:hypothetical protein
MIVFCAVLSGGGDWVGREEFGLEKEAWLRRFLELPNGNPAHDTLSDGFGRIWPEAFAEAFLHWVLDVQFGEDTNRAHKDHSAKNLALVRRMSIIVIRHNGPSKDSVRRRKFRASLNDDYRFQLIFGKPQT